MGAIVKGAASLVGGRKRRREEADAQDAFNKSNQAIQDFNFQNHFEGVQGQGYDAAQAQAGTLGPAAQAQAATLGEANTYDAVGYDSQGYDAERAEAAQAQKTQLGEDTGFRNTFQDLQVNTATADRQAQETDEALAAQAENAALTGGGGATALAAAAAKSKQGVADSIAGQEQQNTQLRAQADQRNQEAALAQRNTARQSNIQQDQFNTGLDQQTRLANQSAANQASQFTASAANQAAQFGASAQNQAAQFGAQAKNQFAQAQFNADNQFALANQNATNQFAQAQFGANNQFALQNAQAQNQASQFGAGQDFAAQQARAQGAQSQEANRFGQQQQQFQINQQRLTDAQNARQQATADLVGGISGAASAIFSDENLKENIKLVGKSPSGINIYHFNYINDDVTYEGVLAQEVEHAAIFDDELGYYKVDYDKIDVEFKQV